MVNNQKLKAKYWTDENGLEVQVSRLTKTEKFVESKSFKVFKMAKAANQKLHSLKDEIHAICQEVYETYMAENNTAESKKTKGNFTFYNFDRSIKIEVSIKDRIEFDDLGISACKSKLDEFLTNNLDSKDVAIKQMVMDAFETSKKKLDVKKVMGLLRFRSKIKHVLFQEAMDQLEKSIRRPSSKTYFRIWEQNIDGGYEAVELNFSSI